MSCKKIYAVQMISSFSKDSAPYTEVTASTRQKASKYIEDMLFPYLNDIYDTWDMIRPSDVPNDLVDSIFGKAIYWEDSVLLQRRKTGEIIMLYTDQMNYIY